jgi:hypothetical protein
VCGQHLRVRVALAEVSCQACGRMFKVALTDPPSSDLSDDIRLGRVDYGDPPNVDCCDLGTSMSSEMHRILEYWSRNIEVSRDWQRNPTFEGEVGEGLLDPPVKIAEVLAAISSGARSVLVMCTSRRNRSDLAGRITAAKANDGSILVAYPENYLGVARGVLLGLVPDKDIGRLKDGRTVTLAEFSQLKDVPLAIFESIVILAGPRPRNEAMQNAWSDLATRFATEAGDKLQIELALAHSCCMIANPNLVVGAGQSVERSS